MTADAGQGPPSGAPNAGPTATKVIGLGAPISVRIRFLPFEVPVVVKALRAELDAAESDPDMDGDRRMELRRMLAAVPTDGREPPGPFDVLWPSALALGVLWEAVRQASRRTLDAIERRASVAEVDAAFGVARASLDTLVAFHAVDSGGLQDVWL